MTHTFERSILILLGAGALTACATPNFPIESPGAQATAPAPPAEPTVPPRADDVPEAPRATAPVESRPLDPPAAAPSTPSPAPAQSYTPPAAPTYRTVTTRSVTGRLVDADGPRKTYEVKSGDNLIAIARKLDTTVDQLREDNDLKSDVIRPGQELKGPQTKVKAYTVAQGDTLSAIGRRFNVTASAIAEANDMSTSATLRVGQRLVLPAGFKDQGPIVTTSRVLVDAPRPAAPPVRVAQAETPPPAPTPPARTPPPVRATPTPAESPAQRRETPPATPRQPQPYSPPPSTQPRTAPSAAPVVGAPVASPPPSDSQITQMGRGVFIWPLRGEVIAGFGPRGTGQRNDGLNIRANTGDPVRAAAAGDVVYAGDQVPGFGNLVLIKHPDGWVTAYGHLSRIDVKMQQKVTQGQQIGQAGASGGISEPQLHFEVRYAPNPQERARPVDPALVLPR